MCTGLAPEFTWRAEFSLERTKQVLCCEKQDAEEFIIWVCHKLISHKMCKCTENQSNYSSKPAVVEPILPVSCMYKFLFPQLKGEKK